MTGSSKTTALSEKAELPEELGTSGFDVSLLLPKSERQPAVSMFPSAPPSNAEVRLMGYNPYRGGPSNDEDHSDPNGAALLEKMLSSVKHNDAFYADSPFSKFGSQARSYQSSGNYSQQTNQTQGTQYTPQTSGTNRFAKAPAQVVQHPAVDSPLGRENIHQKHSIPINQFVDKIEADSTNSILNAEDFLRELKRKRETQSKPQDPQAHSSIKDGHKKSSQQVFQSKQPTETLRKDGTTAKATAAVFVKDIKQAIESQGFIPKPASHNIPTQIQPKSHKFAPKTQTRTKVSSVVPKPQNGQTQPQPSDNTGVILKNYVNPPAPILPPSNFEYVFVVEVSVSKGPQVFGVYSALQKANVAVAQFIGKYGDLIIQSLPSGFSTVMVQKNNFAAYGRVEARELYAKGKLSSLEGRKIYLAVDKLNDNGILVISASEYVSLA